VALKIFILLLLVAIASVLLYEPDPYEGVPTCMLLEDHKGRPYNYEVLATGTEQRPMTREKCEDGWGGVFNPCG